MQITPPLGIYTLAEAAKLLTVKQTSLNRWVHGYNYNAKAAEGVAKKNLNLFGPVNISLKMVWAR
jgi:phage antirepressor YoqD-like protein